MSKRSRRTRSVIYIPGIGDDTKKAQSRLIKLWRLYGVQPIMHEMPWMDAEAWQPKFDRLLERIDSLAEKGHEVSIVGVSAGATAAINAFALRQDKIAAVVCVAGKINHPESIGLTLRQRSPSFFESASETPISLAKLGGDARRRIMSRYAAYDEVVPKEDSKVDGAHNRRVLSFGHGATIVGQVLFGGPFIVRFLKETAK